MYSHLRSDRPQARSCVAFHCKNSFGVNFEQQPRKPVPDALRRLDRDLLADDGARQRVERLAARHQVHARMARMIAAITGSRRASARLALSQ